MGCRDITFAKRSGRNSIAAKKAATVLLEEAVVQTQITAPRLNNPGLVPFFSRQSLKLKLMYASLGLTMRDQVLGGMIIVMLIILLREKIKSRTNISEVKTDEKLASSLKEIDEELVEFDKDLKKKESLTEETDDEFTQEEEKT